MLQPRLLNVEPLGSMRLKLTYETGVAPYATGPWYKELLEDNYFRTVRLLPGGTGIEWGNGQDIAPHELYELSVPA